MSRDVALREAQKLAAAIRARGVKVSIEIQPGVSTSGWYDGRKVGVLSHHIVSRRSQGLTPFLSLVKNGRAGLPGPLCNGYMGWDLVYRIITMGWANHPGLGGPLTLAGLTIPRDNGRPYLWGTEYEGGLNAADWTPEFRRAMGAANAGILDYLGRPVTAHGEHLTWAPGRKIDRLGYTTASGRAEITNAPRPSAPTPAPTAPPEEDMPLNDADLAKIRAIVREEARGEVLRGVLAYRNRELGHNIDIHQRILDIWSKVTGKAPEAAIHPRDRKPGEF